MRKSFQIAARRGFTLIELVIVIAIIAILAVGVIAALNPIEQNNRAKDGKYKNTMSEIMGAIQRYNTAQSYMPFCTSAAGTCTTTTNLLSTVADPSTTTVLNKLISLNEITANFTTATTSELAGIYATYTSASNQVALCYLPLSASAKSDTSILKASTGSGAGNYFCVIQ